MVIVPSDLYNHLSGLRPTEDWNEPRVAFTDQCKKQQAEAPEAEMAEKAWKDETKLQRANLDR